MCSLYLGQVLANISWEELVKYLGFVILMFYATITQFCSYSTKMVGKKMKGCECSSKAAGIETSNEPRWPKNHCFLPLIEATKAAALEKVAVSAAPSQT